MNRFLLAGIVLALVSLASAQAKKEMQETYDAYAAACLHKDTNAVMSFFTEDVVFQRKGAPDQHRKQIREDLDKWIHSFTPETKLWFTVDRVDDLGPSKAKAHITLHFSSGKRGGTSKWLDTWVKTPKGWKNSVGVQLPKGTN